MQNYVALLRGINVGGHHKVPMQLLCDEMKQLGFTEINTLLNSGNVIFYAEDKEVARIENTIAIHLQQVFGFSIPVILIPKQEISGIVDSEPFRKIKQTKDTRLYVSFLQRKPEDEPSLPQATDDDSFRILDLKGRAVFSVLDLSKNKTTKAMEILEQLFGKNLTTRNLNTLIKISQLLK